MQHTIRDSICVRLIRRGGCLLLLFGAMVSLALAHTAVAQDTAAERTVLSGRTELARLVDLAAQRMGISVEYDPAVLKGSVTVRLSEGLTNEELWQLTNRVLANNGFTTVVQPGEEMLSIVRLGDAPGLARLEPERPAGTRAGFATVVVELEHAQVQEVINTLKLLASKPGGSVSQFGDKRVVMLSDLKPRIDQALDVIAVLDQPRSGPEVVKISTTFVPAAELTAMVLNAVKARDAIAGRQSEGTLLPAADGSSVILIAPETERADWIQIISRFDEQQQVQTRTYTPDRFAISEVSSLIEQVGRDPGPRGSGRQWRMVENELTGSLVVTATPSEHQRVGDLMDRLSAVAVDARRAVRSFKVRNRNVTEILDVLSALIEEGVLGTDSDAEAGGTGRVDARPTRQRTVRENRPFEPDQTVLSSEGGGASGRSSRSGAASTYGPEGDGAGFGAPRAGGELTLTADESTNTLIAMGSPRLLAQLEQLISELDVRQPQVMLEVLVVSLSESDLLDLGIELEKLEFHDPTSISLSSLFGLSTRTGATNPQVSDGQGFTGIVLSPGDFSVVIRALQSINEGRSLTIPRVLVNNNEEALLDSVLQQPVQSTNASTTVATTSFAGTQDAGTSVTVRPSIAEGDHLVLSYSVVLSSFIGESATPALPPPRQQNSLQSIVTIPDSYTVVVGGLETRSDSEAVSQIPLLGDIPVLGEAFKTRSRSNTMSRFYVFIRASILRHGSFEDLKFISDQESAAAEIGDGWPEVKPGIIR